MATRNIKCAGCGHEGKVEAHDTISTTPESDIFKTLGKDSSTGFLHFICPSCNEDLSVDPFKVIMASQIIGKPSNYSPSSSSPAPDSSASPQTGRHVPIIWGLIYLAAAIFIFAKFTGWWTYIVGGLLFMLAWVSLKTGIFASNKEIKELTDDGPVSEETKKKFQDRI
ncbi:MAG: hypothetical protein IEMM0007_0700 [bacterium]|nr:MAG: hypothetical protein IEMM0007_0700 [bacterium]